jgi:hypothetical protein
MFGLKEWKREPVEPIEPAGGGMIDAELAKLADTEAELLEIERAKHRTREGDHRRQVLERRATECRTRVMEFRNEARYLRDRLERIDHGSLAAVLKAQTKSTEAIGNLVAFDERVAVAVRRDERNRDTAAARISATHAALTEARHDVEYARAEWKRIESTRTARQARSEVVTRADAKTALTIAGNVKCEAVKALAEARFGWWQVAGRGQGLDRLIDRVTRQRTRHLWNAEQAIADHTAAVNSASEAACQVRVRLDHLCGDSAGRVIQ